MRNVLEKACEIENFAFCKVEMKTGRESGVSQLFSLDTRFPATWNVVELIKKDSEFNETLALLERLQVASEFLEINVTTNSTETGDSGGKYCDTFNDLKVLVWFATVVGGMSVIAAEA